MLCKPLFIVHVRVKGLFKVILQYKNKVPQLKKWITMKSKETSKHNSSCLASYIHACMNEIHSIENLRDLISTLASLG